MMIIIIYGKNNNDDDDNNNLIIIDREYICLYVCKFVCYATPRQFASRAQNIHGFTYDPTVESSQKFIALFTSFPRMSHIT